MGRIAEVTIQETVHVGASLDVGTIRNPATWGCIHAYLLFFLAVELAIALVLPIPLWAAIVGWLCVAVITVTVFFTSGWFQDLLSRLKQHIENTPR